MKKFLLNYYFLLLILIYSTIMFSINLNKPFIGHHDWNGAWYSNIARNFLRYGLISTKFGSVINVDIVNSSSFGYFTHYPPLLPIFLYFSFKIFGIHEWSARLVPIIFSLFTIVMVYLLALKFFDKKTATLSAALSSVIPITVYFAKMPVQEVVVLAPILLSIYFYFEFFNAPTGKNLIKLILSLIFSHLINWPGYYVTPLFFLHFLIFSKTKNRFKIAAIFPALSILMFTMHLLHVLLLTGKFFGGDLFGAFLYRLNVSEKPLGYTTLNFIKLQAHLLAVYFTRPVLIFSLLSAVWLLIHAKRNSISPKVQFLAMLAIFGATHNLAFRNMAFIHDYMIIYIWPFMVISASFGFFTLTSKLKIKPALQIILSLVLLVLIATERQQFLKVLLATNGLEPGRIIGNYINKHTKSGEKTLILSTDFKQYFEVPVAFYSDRNVNYQVTTTQNLTHYLLNKNYRLIVAVSGRENTVGQVAILQNNYPETKIGEFLIFDTNAFQTANSSNFNLK